jgi:hypothetical protein
LLHGDLHHENIVQGPGLRNELLAFRNRLPYPLLPGHFQIHSPPLTPSPVKRERASPGMTLSRGGRGVTASG